MLRLKTLSSFWELAPGIGISAGRYRGSQNWADDCEAVAIHCWFWEVKKKPIWQTNYKQRLASASSTLRDKQPCVSPPNCWPAAIFLSAMIRARCTWPPRCMCRSSKFVRIRKPVVWTTKDRRCDSIPGLVIMYWFSRTRDPDDAATAVMRGLLTAYVM